MARKSAQMTELENMLREKEGQLSVLQAEIALLKEAIRRTGGEVEAPRQKRAGRSNVKKLVLDLLEEAGAKGINASIALEMAEKRGEQLERGSVSSLLSRLKNDGVVTYDSVVYRLTKYSNDGGDFKLSGDVVTHPSSRVAL